MEDLLKQIALSYFLYRNKKYSYRELAEVIGVSISDVGDLIESLLTENLIIFKDGLIKLTVKGRAEVAISKFEKFNYVSNNEEKSLEEEKVKLMEPFYPKNFHRKKWKGSI